MARFGAWSFGRRVAAGLLASSVLTALMALTAARTVTQIVRTKDRLLEASGPELISIDRARLIEARRVGAARGYLLTSDAQFRARYRADDQSFLRELRRYERLDPSGETRSMVRGIERNYAEYVQEFERTAGLRQAGKSLPSVVQRYEAVVEPQREQVDKIMTALVQREAAQLEQDRSRSDPPTFRAPAFIWFAGAFLLLASLLLARNVSLALGRAHEKEREAARTRGELKASRAAYEELQAVSYAISHNLRAPLRAIDASARAALGPAPPQSRRSLESIRASVGRMSALLEALLEMLGASSGPLRPEPVDLSAMARELLEALAPAGMETRVEPGLRCRADPALLRVALTKLLHNAVKFSARAARPRVEVAAAGEGGGFVVRDNGAGFDMAHASRLFVPFQRLHGHDEFPGAGMGLPVVARIIERHGGRIRAEAAPGRGAAFYVTLP